MSGDPSSVSHVARSALVVTLTNTPRESDSDARMGANRIDSVARSVTALAAATTPASWLVRYRTRSPRDARGPLEQPSTPHMTVLRRRGSHNSAMRNR